MIRHQTIGGDTDLGLSLGLGQNLLKRGVISGFLKQGKSPNPTVQDMIGEISSSKAWTARHRESSTECEALLSRKDSRPLLFRREHMELVH